ncbi:hypothetical protein CU311_03920 [Prochlorococcus marinus str. MU1402]|uniref:hypothetical protein n=1 Tax=Prochlorococcus marinus TaxID=1219 RepID=UPI001ADC6BDB|nr:hypothetical protein [Prochlorococcus marinus]MBO8231805.1 hypothetical protein [Prochlorococcus marinus XMU1402]MBW3056554.1 hypothetical protein [Prochlorococcus marinus str. MU1402]
MKLAINLCLFLFVLVISGDKSFSLTDYQIKRFCKNEKRHLTCIKNLRKKRFDLNNGKLIEVPVIPFKR